MVLGQGKDMHHWSYYRGTWWEVPRALGNAAKSTRLHSLDPGLDSLISNTKGPQASHLLDAGLVGVEQRPCLHVFRHQTAAHSGDVLPVPQGTQCHVLLCGPPLTCGWQSVSCPAERDLCWPETQEQRGP